MKRKTLIAVHIAYWIYLLIFVQFFNELAYKNRLPSLSRYFSPIFLSNVVLFAGIFYTNYFAVLPYYFHRKRYVGIVVSWVLLALLFVGARYGVQEYLFLKYLGICNYCDSDFSGQWGIYVVNNFIQSVGELLLPGTIIWFIDNWVHAERRQLQLQQEKVDAERSLLQSQISPHFLFNCLNNIYSMVYHQSENSLPAIQKLSGIMRYMMTDSSSELIPLSKEMDYLRDYIELQQYRSRQTAIQYAVGGKAGQQLIAPLLLISFVENAFKHGVTTDPAQPILIRLDIQEDALTFSVHNKINQHSKDVTSGIGLNNVRHRLALQYAGKHTLDIRENGSTFDVHLSLKLQNTDYDKMSAGRR